MQLVNDRRLSSLEIPPPKAVPDELTRLLLMAVLVIVALPEVVSMPPPSVVAWFLVIFEAETTSVP